jgi:hypothetical protein
VNRYNFIAAFGLGICICINRERGRRYRQQRKTRSRVYSGIQQFNALSVRRRLTADLSLKRSKITNLEKVAEIPFVTPTTPKNSAFGHSEMHAVDTVAWKGCTLIYVNVARTLGCDR